MDRVVTSGSLGGQMVSTLAQNAIDVGSLPTQDARPDGQSLRYSATAVPLAIALECLSVC